MKIDGIQETVVRHRADQIPVLLEFDMTAKTVPGDVGVLELTVDKVRRIVTLDGTLLGTFTADDEDEVEVQS